MRERFYWDWFKSNRTTWFLLAVSVFLIISNTVRDIQNDGAFAGLRMFAIYAIATTLVVVVIVPKVLSVVDRADARNVEDD